MMSCQMAGEGVCFSQQLWNMGTDIDESITQYFGSTTNFLDDNDTSSFQQRGLFKKDWKSRAGEKNSPISSKCVAVMFRPFLTQAKILQSLWYQLITNLPDTLHMILINLAIWFGVQSKTRSEK